MNIIRAYQTKNECFKAARTMTPQGIVVHSTGANNKNLRRYVYAPDELGRNLYGNHWNRKGVMKMVHAFIGLDKDGSVRVVNTLPYNYCAWGVGRGSRGSYNYAPAYIQFEICEDNLKDEAYFNRAFKLAIEYCAYLCKTYNLSVDNVVSHKEANIRGYASNHADCDHWLARFGKTMEWFREEVKKLVEEKPETETETEVFEPYRVRVSISNLFIRKGAGTNYGRKGFIKKGVYTIVEEADGKGATTWGKLKSGAGWISLDYVQKL